MEREILCEVYPWESRVAIVEDGRLAEVFWANQDERVGNIYKGKVKDIIAGLSCAFIDIGLSKNAFLYAGDVCCPEEKRGCNLFDLLKTGQDIMVQVKKEAFSEKGARVTGNLSLPGQFLVLLPYQREICISRKITDSKLRDRLKEIVDANKPECMGVIIRTACLQADENEIAAEMERLMMVWNDINRRYENSRAPSLLYEDMDVLERTLRDYIDKDVSRILVNNPKLKEKIMDCITERKSPIVPVLYEKGELFEKYGLEKDIKRALRRKVWLKSGGYLIFDETEAMTVIDVNSGKYTGTDDFEDTVFKLNLEAAIEIPRQLRLRSMGGIILIDFIDMKDKDNEAAVINRLKSELEKDKAHTRIIGMTGLGFLEMTRKRSRYGISEFFTDECSACSGRGRIINMFAFACEIKRKLANMGYLEAEELTCEVHPQVMPFITENGENLAYIEKRIQKKVNIVANDNLKITDFNVHSGPYEK
ncbi:MAG: Rne/Rng family ribonuclease [Syntrophomonadaceae bacterium]